MVRSERAFVKAVARMERMAPRDPPADSVVSAI